MTVDHFQTTTRGVQRRRTPFRPYIVELASGERINIDQPCALEIAVGSASSSAPPAHAAFSTTKQPARSSPTPTNPPRRDSLADAMGEKAQW
jgi:hypothetical protein